MHRICSYVAMFSPSLADYFIQKYSEENDIVLDTFSGRGTTLLQSRLLNRETYAIDLNPFAYVLSRAKSQSFKLNEVLIRIKYWEEKYCKDKKIYFSNW
ncbi:DNA methyltransferase [Spiroplasma endosymbiont of Andrena trimmerana]|uniref:DNA methyltransferase n=1 Tax=Spiroplasma endosymbiont of Andrena trimmerana TaxID=3066316 RepID=UPI0030CCFE85